MSTAAKKTLGQKLLAAMGDVHMLEKDSFNSHARYNYVSHDTYMEAARPILTQHGIVASFNQVSCVVGKSGLLVECELRLLNADNIEEEITSTAFHLQPFQGKDGIRPTGKEMGAAYSYCAKYLIAKALMMSSGEDVDAEGDTPRNKPEPKAKKAPPKKKAPPEKPTPKKAAKKKAPSPPPSESDEDYEPIIPEEEWDEVRELWHSRGTISEAQGKRIFGVARGEGGWEGNHVRAEIDAGLGVDIDDIPWGDPYNKIVSLFQEYAAPGTESQSAEREDDGEHDGGPDDDIPF